MRRVSAHGALLPSRDQVVEPCAHFPDWSLERAHGARLPALFNSPNTPTMAWQLPLGRTFLLYTRKLTKYLTENYQIQF